MAVLDVGAYGFTESMPLFLSHPIPAEVVVRGGRAALIRPRQEPGEWLDRQRLPAFAVRRADRLGGVLLGLDGRVGRARRSRSGC